MASGAEVITSDTELGGSSGRSTCSGAGTDMQQQDAVHEIGAKAMQTKLLAVQTVHTETAGRRHYSVALHEKDLIALQYEMQAVRDDVGALRKMDLKSLQAEMNDLRAELEGLRHDTVMHTKDRNALQTQLVAVKDDVGTLRKMDVKALHDAGAANRAGGSEA